MASGSNEAKSCNDGTHAPCSSDTLRPIHQPRHMRIVCIGAGIAGLCFAYKLQRSFEDYELRIYEKNQGISGVWFENRYPGVACDFPAHNYTYSFEPKHDFPSVYAKGEDVRQYLISFSAKYSLDKYIKTGHQVIRAEWMDLEGSWRVQIKELLSGHVIDDVCDILISATGVLNSWRWPDIPGLKSFAGTLVHSARWDENLDVKGKRVGIIGNGSSGQQLVSSIQPIAGQLAHFIRQPTWVIGAFGDQPREYTQEEVSAFKNKPGHLLQIRKEFERKVNSYFTNFLKDSPAQAQMRAFITEAMKDKLGSSDLQKLLIPDYGIGCRRVTPGTDYLEALIAHNTKIIFGNIKQITRRGVEDHEGQEHILDILICATGFDTSYKPRFPLIGAHGKNLQDEWSQSTKAYMATAIPEFPNYFLFFGPNNPFASGSYIPAIGTLTSNYREKMFAMLISRTESQADYMLKFCDRWQTENIHSFRPKWEAVEDFLAHVEDFVDKTVWADNCRSWYKKGTADKAALILWPGSGLHFIEALSDVRADDFEIAYNGNRFAWLGNGYSQTEKDPTADPAYYIREYDDGPYLSRGRRRKAQTKFPTSNFSEI